MYRQHTHHTEQTGNLGKSTHWKGEGKEVHFQSCLKGKFQKSKNRVCLKYKIVGYVVI